MLKRTLVMLVMLTLLVSSATYAAEKLADGINYHKEGEEETYSCEDNTIILAEKMLELRKKLLKEGRLMQVSTQIVEEKSGKKHKSVILTASTERTNMEPFEVLVYKTDNEFFANDTQVALTKEIKNRFLLISRYEHREANGERQIVLIMNRHLDLEN